MKKIKIGIADDNREFCDILVDYFREKEDIDLVFISHDGIKTIDYINMKQPDILVLDMIMPHLDGLGVLETINNMELEKYPRTIVLSAVGQEPITQKAISLGAEYYIVKPFNLDVLMKRINQLAGVYDDAVRQSNFDRRQRGRGKEARDRDNKHNSRNRRACPYKGVSLSPGCHNHGCGGY